VVRDVEAGPGLPRRRHFVSLVDVWIHKLGSSVCFFALSSFVAASLVSRSIFSSTFLVLKLTLNYIFLI
jgi:hypothetical protein